MNAATQNQKLSIIDHQSSIPNPLVAYVDSLADVADIFQLPTSTPPPLISQLRHLLDQRIDQLESEFQKLDPSAPDLGTHRATYQKSRARLWTKILQLNEAHRETIGLNLPTEFTIPRPEQRSLREIVPASAVPALPAASSPLPLALAENPPPIAERPPAEPNPTPNISANNRPTAADPVQSPANSDPSSASFDHHNDEDLADAYLHLNENLRGRPSPLRKLTPQQQETLFQLLSANSSATVLELITQPEPIGFGIQTNARSLRRFRQEYADAAKKREHTARAEKAQQILNSQNPDETFHLELKRRIQHSLLLSDTADPNFAPHIHAGLTNLTKLQKLNP